MPLPLNERASILLVEECFSRQDAGFLDALRLLTQPKVLGAFADRWKKDPRPWARAQIFHYLDLPLDCPGHQPLVKHLFKDAEERKDHELMAAFLVAFDTAVRRVRQPHFTWDRATRSALESERLATPRDVLPLANDLASVLFDPKTGQRVAVAKNGRRLRGARLFSHRTRHYLRRRAWRYFRWLGYGQPTAYPTAILPALRRYRDADLEKGEHILDSWALLQICFHGGDVIEFHWRHHRLRPGRSLAELRAAPRFPAAWETPVVARTVFQLVAAAQATLVRRWAMDFFRGLQARHALELSADELLALLDHADERVQQFGAELFDTQAGNALLPVATWLRLLKTQNLIALATLCTAFERHVSGERLTLAQSVELAVARPVPVAHLGFKLLQARLIPVSEASSLATLADARCESLAGALAAWALARLGTPERYTVDAVSRFFDSLQPPTRDAAWAWLTTQINVHEGAPARPTGYDDPVLWSRLAETPFDDLKLKLVDHLALRLETPGQSADRLAPVWCAVLLGVHRGGRQKLKAVRELADAIARAPADQGAPGTGGAAFASERPTADTGIGSVAARLLPVLAVAVRSVRGPERRAGLSAVMTLVARRPELAGAVRARLPELVFTGQTEPEGAG